jgi:hypothetical protein
MQKYLLLLLLAVNSTLLPANISAILVGGGTVTPRENTKVQLVKEEMLFDIGTYFHVSITYLFYNHGFSSQSEYLYGTGRTWYGEIEELKSTIQVDNTTYILEDI